MSTYKPQVGDTVTYGGHTWRVGWFVEDLFNTRGSVVDLYRTVRHFHDFLPCTGRPGVTEHQIQETGVPADQVELWVDTRKPNPKPIPPKPSTVTYQGATWDVTSWANTVYLDGSIVASATFARPKPPEFKPGDWITTKGLRDEGTPGATCQVTKVTDTGYDVTGGWKLLGIPVTGITHGTAAASPHGWRVGDKCYTLQGRECLVSRVNDDGIDLTAAKPPQGWTALILHDCKPNEIFLVNPNE